MIKAGPADPTGGAGLDAGGGAAALGLPDWLCLAATPGFAIMALMTAVLGDGPMHMICSAGRGSALAGMVPMYLLMSAVHLPPWLRLFCYRRGRGQRSSPCQPPNPANAIATAS